ncbi:MAG: DUF1349 domain-containing protein [Promethearchaeota archaeon]
MKEKKTKNVSQIIFIVIILQLFLISMLNLDVHIERGKYFPPENVDFDYFKEFSASVHITGDFIDDFLGPTLMEGWNWINPKGDGTYNFTTNPGFLTLYTPPYHDLIPSKLDAPRIFRSVSGDFEIETRLLFEPSVFAMHAGLVVWDNQLNFFRFERGIGWYTHTNGLLVWRYNGSYTGKDINFTPTDTYLRVERKGNTFTANYSTDGMNWQTLYSFNQPMSMTVEVGLDIISEFNSYSVNASFDYFNIYLINHPNPPILYPILPEIDDDGIVRLNWSDGENINTYYVYRATSNITLIANLSSIAAVPANNYQDSISRNGIYYYVIVASNASGNSSPSNCESVVVAISPPNPPILYPILPEIDDDGIVRLNWSDGENITTYYVYRATSKITSIANFSAIAAVPTSNYQDSISRNGIYYYVIVASNAYGNSSISNCESVVVAIPPPNPPILYPILPEIDDDGIVRLNWSDGENITTYYVYRTTSNINSIANLSAIAAVPISNYQDSISRNGIYYYVIVASNTYGNSSPSNCESVVVAISPPNPPILYPIIVIVLIIIGGCSLIVANSYYKWRLGEKIKRKFSGMKSSYVQRKQRKRELKKGRRRKRKIELERERIMVSERIKEISKKYPLLFLSELREETHLDELNLKKIILELIDQGKIKGKYDDTNQTLTFEISRPRDEEDQIAPIGLSLNEKWRSAVTNVITILETELRALLKPDYPINLRGLVQLAVQQKHIPPTKRPILHRWINIRNQLAHDSNKKVDPKKAKQIVEGVRDILKSIGRQPSQL